MASPQPDSRATTIYNIIRFVSFPGHRVHRRLCARPDLAARIQPIHGQPLGDGTLDVVPTTRWADRATQCDVVYLGTTSPAAFPVTPGQILIGEGIGFAQAGGTVGLVTAGPRMRFAINTRSATLAHVHVSAQLMRLAVKIFN